MKFAAFLLVAMQAAVASAGWTYDDGNHLVMVKPDEAMPNSCVIDGEEQMRRRKERARKLFAIDFPCPAGYDVYEVSILVEPETTHVGEFSPLLRLESFIFHGENL